MKLVVFGVTGPTGREVAEQALAAGYNVTALARDPSRIASELRGEVIEVKGDVLDPAAVATALHGADAVISCLGTKPWKHVDIVSTGTRVITGAMAVSGVRRLVAMSSLGVGESRIAGLVGKIAHRLLAKSFRDKGIMESELATTALDWVIVRPTQLTNGSARGTWRAADDGSITGGKISRADTAAFMLAQLHSDEWLHRRPVLAY